MASGYLNKPELTDKAFLRRTIDAGPEQRVYRTGDLVRYRGDGVLRILGRLDSQVKVRGFRVELGEIEATLRQHESVSGAVVGVRADRTGMQSLVAYVIPSDEKGISSAQLRDFVGNSLPPYMVPQSIVTVPAIPRLPNGKTDRQTLIQSEPGIPPQQAAAEYTPDALSRQLVAIWEQVLATSPVGVADDFFDLGGHSLLAAQMMAEVEEQLGVQPSLSAFLQSPTVAEPRGLSGRRRISGPGRLWCLSSHTVRNLLSIWCMGWGEASPITLHWPGYWVQTNRSTACRHAAAATTRRRTRRLRRWLNAMWMPCAPRSRRDPSILLDIPTAALWPMKWPASSNAVDETRAPGADRTDRTLVGVL